ncbi:hypothetical protein BDW02DRAFT_650155 [Decorospora gaudefroyi]|uniref:Uncharacterized protein n=1 Tax=Decorospora gaudefroyi TaxID=184978 RepID=A0A6A5K4Q4_9PLEO|nr:hypothetical protein BDW02DRAFT_650155 [Decorospora gaudefroyi]
MASEASNSKARSEAGAIDHQPLTVKPPERQSPSPGNFLRNLKLQPILWQPDSPLLRLPRELRDHIVNYILTPEDGLLFQWGGVDERSYFIKLAIREDEGRQDSDEFNQVKFACRQLYAETACIELHFNETHFSDAQHPELGPSVRFQEFIEQCAPLHVSKITQVTLDIKYDAEVDLPQDMIMRQTHELQPIVDFCQKNPHMTVNYMIVSFVDALDGNWSRWYPQDGCPSDPLCFMATGIWLVYLFRGISLRGLVSDFVSMIDTWCNLPSSVVEKTQIVLDVPNLRLWPWERRTCKFDWEQMCKYCAILDMTNEKGIYCMGIGLMWSKHGF